MLRAPCGLIEWEPPPPYPPLLLLSEARFGGPLLSLSMNLQIPSVNRHLS